LKEQLIGSFLYTQKVSLEIRRYKRIFRV